MNGILPICCQGFIDFRLFSQITDLQRLKHAVKIFIQSAAIKVTNLVELIL